METVKEQKSISQYKRLIAMKVSECLFVERAKMRNAREAIYRKISYDHPDYKYETELVKDMDKKVLGINVTRIA